MRKTFQETLLKEMMDDDRIFLLVGDLGYKMFDSHFAAFPNRAINVGAAEQALLDIAVGLAYEDQIPVCYSITPFLIYRPFETIRTYINHEKLPVKLIGSGMDKDYDHDGISHWAEDARTYLEHFTNMVKYYPQTKKNVKDWTHELLHNNKPSFMGLRR